MPAPLRTMLLLGALAVAPAGCSDPPSNDGDSDPIDGRAPDSNDPDAPGDADGGVDAPVGDGATPDAPTDAGVDSPPPIDAPAELQVCPGSGHTITSAIAAVAPGGTVFVCAGTYAERVTISGKSVSLIGMGGADETFLDGGAGGTVLTVDGAPNVVVEGFTIRNGSAAVGGGVRCNASKLRVARTTITGNVASVEGGGFHATGCDLDLDLLAVSQNAGGELGGGLVLRDSMGALHAGNIADNDAEDGGGVAVIGGTLVLADNLIRSNTAALQGGGLWHSSDAMVANNTFEDNIAGWTGGGIYVDAHAAIFAMNTVRGSTSQNDGGGIYVHQGSATFRGNHIVDNHSTDDGGGLRLFENRSLVENNIIENNTAGDAGGGIRVSHIPALFMNNIVRNNDAVGTGGGMDMDNDSSTVIGGEISGNHASSGGGIYHWLGPWNGAVLINVKFTDNDAWRGGAIFLDDNFQPVTMRGLIFEGNHAGRGGALHVRATNWTLRNAVFIDNDAAIGGAIFHGANSPWWEECTSMFPCPPTSPTGRIDFSVFHANESDDGAAIWVDAPTLHVSNSIFTDNVGSATVSLAQPEPSPPINGMPEMPRPFPTVHWRYNNTSPSAFAGMGDPNGSDGNLSGPASFVDVASRDFHLAPASICRNAGDPAILDLDGSRADMGAFGGPGAVGSAP